MSIQWGHVEHGQFTKPHFYLAGLVLKAVNQYCAHSFARNWQLTFLNQRKGENDRRKYFIIQSPRKNVADPVGSKRNRLITSRMRIQLSHRGVYKMYLMDGILCVFIIYLVVTYAVTFNIACTLQTFAPIEYSNQHMHAYNLIRDFICLIIKTYNFDTIKPLFYIVKLGFTEVCIIFLISAQNIDCGYSLEPPRRGSSNE